MINMLSGCLAGLAFFLAGLYSAAATPLVLTVPTPRATDSGYLKMGTALRPDGRELTADSQSLRLDGQPWVPVMGEFHYARYPQSEWRDEMRFAAIKTAPQCSDQVITNPLVRQRADPFIYRHTDGNYYFTASVPEFDRIELRRATTLDGLGQADPITIWKKHDSGQMSAFIWAPELHFINGKWYLYFAAGMQAKDWGIRIYVLENPSPDPLTGTWVEKGQLKTNWDSFSLDATTFEHRGQRYLVWAQKDPAIKGNTNLYIAEMDTPWSITGRQILLSKPDLPWEQVRYLVNEGPAVLKKNGRIFLTYSASATDANYCMGMLTASDDSDLLNAKSWAKSPEPVFRTDAEAGQFGPGHNCFTVLPDGQTDVLVYHARNYEQIPSDPLRDPNRHARAQIIHWKPDGTPDFGHPIPDTTPKLPLELF